MLVMQEPADQLTVLNINLLPLLTEVTEHILIS